MATTDPEPWSLERLHILVRDLRDAQRKYWRDHRRASYVDDRTNLRNAIELERQVDDAIKQLEARLPLFDRETPPALPGD
jgi:hypothetical protein